jgi:hypothetical protein
MYVGMGLRKNEHGVWVVRHKVPAHLEEPVARVLNNGKERQAYLQKTTGTKDKKEATRLRRSDRSDHYAPRWHSLK